MLEKGKLFIVSTPIGNLGDITLRAIKTLKEVDLVIAEDTRRVRKLFNHYNIKKKTLSYHDYNKVTRTPFIISKLKAGLNIGLVSDSGTPGIADPGFYLIREAIKNGIKIIPIPGVTALIPALIVSGFPTDRFTFEGWLPRKKKKRREKLTSLKSETKTIIMFESPHRLVNTLEDCLEILGNRGITICRELTKKYENIQRGKINELLEYYRENEPKGEFVIVIEGENPKRKE